MLIFCLNAKKKKSIFPGKVPKGQNHEDVRASRVGEKRHVSAVIISFRIFLDVFPVEVSTPPPLPNDSYILEHDT